MTTIFLTKYSIAKKGAFIDYKRSLEYQSMDIDALRSINFKKFKSLVTHAYYNVPFYEKLYKSAQVKPEDILNYADISKLPVVRRNDLLENYSDFFARNTKKNQFRYSTTGGSTGTPVKIALTKKANREIQKWILLDWWGLKPIDNIATLYRGLPNSKITQFVSKLIYFPQKKILFDATNISSKSIQDFILKLNKIKPKLIHGYVGAVDEIANYLLDNDITLTYNPNVIWLTASPITRVQEEKISKAFNSKVCDQYGCSEIYYISAECPKKEGLHVFSDSRYVEFLNEEDLVVPTGTLGKVTITNLEEKNFPLIRYQNGDVSRYLNHQCSCGISHPLMDKVIGRISDNIKLPDNRIISGEFLTCLFDDFTDYVKEFQIIQSEDWVINVRIVFYKHCTCKNKVITSTYNTLLTIVNNPELVKISEVNQIKNQKGKLQFIISNV